MFNKAVGAEDNTIMCKDNIFVRNLNVVHNIVVNNLCDKNNKVIVNPLSIEAKALNELKMLGIVEVDASMIIDEDKQCATLSTTIEVFVDSINIVKRNASKIELEDF